MDVLATDLEDEPESCHCCGRQYCCPAGVQPMCQSQWKFISSTKGFNSACTGMIYPLTNYSIPPPQVLRGKQFKKHFVLYCLVSSSTFFHVVFVGQSKYVRPTVCVCVSFSVMISWISLFRGREDLCASDGGGTAEEPGGADAGDAFEAAVCPVPLGSTGIHWAQMVDEIEKRDPDISWYGNGVWDDDMATPNDIMKEEKVVNLDFRNGASLTASQICHLCLVWGTCIGLYGL